MKRMLKLAVLTTVLLSSASSYAVVCTYEGPLGAMWTRNGAGTGQAETARERAKMACEEGKGAPGRCRFIRCDYNAFKEGVYRPGH